MKTGSRYELDCDSMGRPAVGDTLLAAIGDAQVFWITQQADGVFVLREQCDRAYAVRLTREQLLELADEIRALAGAER